MHKSDKIHAHTIMMHSVQALYCNWDCHWDCLRILGIIFTKRKMNSEVSEFRNSSFSFYNLLIFLSPQILIRRSLFYIPWRKYPIWWVSMTLVISVSVSSRKREWHPRSIGIKCWNKPLFRVRNEHKLLESCCIWITWKLNKVYDYIFDMLAGYWLDNSLEYKKGSFG